MSQRRSDVMESIGERALTFGAGGIGALLLGGLFYKYRGDGMLVGLAWVLILGGALMILLSIWAASRATKVGVYKIVCPFCDYANSLAEACAGDFLCSSCNRLIPIKDGSPMKVDQVRCGFCSTLNYYSDRDSVLICESCAREIPLNVAEGQEVKHVPKAYSYTEDERMYELVLVDGGPKHEEVISTLQHMLALNRNQVKQILEELPATLLTGIPKKKAEILTAQLAAHDAKAEYHPL